MNDFSQLFRELTKNFKDLSRRVAKFETWEPASGFTDTSAHAYRTTVQALTNGVDNKILFDAELWDTDTIHSAGTFTIPYDGKYLINTKVSMVGAAGNFDIKIYKSATEIVAMHHNLFWSDGHISAIMNFSASDTFEIQVNPSVGVNLTGDANGYVSFCQVQRVG